MTTNQSDSKEQQIKLTSFTKGGGCGCKIDPAFLREVLAGVRNRNEFPSLLVGNQTNDDAAVWDMGNGQAMINTVDFFMPIVDDAYEFGRIAATNAISDVYAMGGKPVFANAILGWPVESLPASLATRVLDGAVTVCGNAGIPLAGGHSIDSPEPLFGLSVVGMAPTINIRRNSTAKEGDLLFLTKPLGTGIMASAIKAGIAQSEHVAETVKWMTTLNRVGELIAGIEGVHAMTDVTGFGLLGHLVEMMEGSGTSAVINLSRIPTLPFLDEYIQKNTVPKNTYRNWNSYDNKVNGLADARAFLLLNDPQTSGGLLVAVKESALGVMQKLLQENGLSGFAEPIGRVTTKDEFVVSIQ